MTKYDQSNRKIYKVSFEQFKGDWVDTFEEGDEDIQAIYDSIRLPERATAGSAGYDFFAPRAFVIKPGETIKIPTGIRAEIDEGWVLTYFQGAAWVLSTVCS